MRYKYVYMTFPRAYSKSFLSILTLMLKCILYPRSKLFVTAGGKQQAAGIIVEKVEEICSLVPAFERELDLRPGRTRKSKDYTIYMFKNGSYFDNIAARESSRGKRRHSGLVEECVGVDGDILQSVIIPTMNVSRICMDGSMHPEEALNQSQIFVKYFGQNLIINFRQFSILLGSPDGDFIKKLILKNPLNCVDIQNRRYAAKPFIRNVQRLLIDSSESKRWGSKQVKLQNKIQSDLHGDMQLDIIPQKDQRTFWNINVRPLVGKVLMLMQS